MLMRRLMQRLILILNMWPPHHCFGHHQKRTTMMRVNNQPLALLPMALKMMMGSNHPLAIQLALARTLGRPCMK